MSDATDSQNSSGNASVDVSDGTSPERSFYESERSTPSGLAKAAKRTRKQKNSDDEDEDFNIEVTSKKSADVRKEYQGQQSKKGTSKESISASTKRKLSLEEPNGT